MHYLLAAVLFLGILTLWVPGYWSDAIFEVSVFGLAIGAVFRSLRTPPRFTYPLAPLLFAVFWGLFQWWTGRTGSPFETKIALARWTAMLAIFVIGLILFRNAGVHRWFRTAMLWFGFGVALLATLQTFTTSGKVFWIFQSEYTERVMGPFVSQNHFAAFIELVLPLAIYGSLRDRPNALLYSGMAGAMYASVIASASRAGFVLASAEFVAVTALLSLQGRGAGHDVGWLVLRVVLLMAVFTAVVGWGTVWKRLQTPDPFSDRRELNTSSLHMIAERPWFGFGLGTWPVVYPQYATIDDGTFVNHAHNDWLEWTAEGGLPLGLAMVSVFLWCLRPAFRTVWGVGVISVFLHATVDFSFSSPALAAWTVVGIALLATSPRGDVTGRSPENQWKDPTQSGRTRG